MDIKEMVNVLRSNSSLKYEMLREFSVSDAPVVEKYFVDAISGFSAYSFIKALELYISENCHVTVRDIVDGRDASLFEFEGVAYHLVDITEDGPVFKKIGSFDKLIPPFKMDDVVNRLF